MISRKMPTAGVFSADARRSSLETPDLVERGDGTGLKLRASLRRCARSALYQRSVRV